MGRVSRKPWTFPPVAIDSRQRGAVVFTFGKLMIGVTRKGIDVALDLGDHHEINLAERT